MAYTTIEGRQQLLDSLATAADQLSAGLALLSEAYEHLDESTAERLEVELFQPMQSAYGRTKRTYSSFAERSELPSHTFQTAPQVAPSGGTKELIEAAIDAAVKADVTLSGSQDSMLPVEVGDAELRAGISQVRESIAGLRKRARELTRTLGR